MSAPTAPVYGFQGKLYYNSGSYASPTWVLIDNVGDIDVTLESNEVPLNLRSGGGYEMFVAGLIKYGLGFKMMYDPADTAQTALRTAYFARTGVEFLVLDGPSGTAGSAGMRAMMGVFKMPRTEEINGVMMADIALKPTYSANAPAPYTAA